MWVFTRPRGGQVYNLLMSETRGGSWFCPIHRFDGLNQISVRSNGKVQELLRYEESHVRNGRDRESFANSGMKIREISWK
jgi:hypothetical protein